MKYLFISLLVLLVSLYLGIEIAKVNNYVLIVYHHFMIESSVWVALLILIAIFIALYLMMRAIVHVAQTPRHFRAWRLSRRAHKARVLTQHGLCELAEGAWLKAEETLIDAAKLKKKPLVNYLAAAKAAQAQQAFERRDNYLRLAHRSDKKATLAIGLTQAQLQIESKQWEQALATLQHLYQRAPRHSYTLKLLAFVCVELCEWTSAEKLLPAIKKQHALPDKDYLQLERKIYLCRLTQAGQKPATTLQQFWHALPKHYQQDTEFATQYTELLLAQKLDEVAIEYIEHFLKKNWQPKLVTLYSQAQHPADPHHLLKVAEHWLKKHPRDPTLLLTLSRLSAREASWDKARHYLQQSVDIRPTAISYTELGDLCQLLNENKAAQLYFRKALALALQYDA